MKNTSAHSVESLKQLLGERVKQVRIARDLTQQQCAYEAGISLRTQVRLEKGESDSLAVLIQVLQALGLGASLLQLIPEQAGSPLASIKGQGRSEKPRQRVRPKSASQKGKGWRGFKDPVSFGDDD